MRLTVAFTTVSPPQTILDPLSCASAQQHPQQYPHVAATAAPKMPFHHPIIAVK
jgi:hypothetical protein